MRRLKKFFKSSSNPDLDFDHSNCKIHQLKSDDNLPTVSRITENYQFRAFSEKLRFSLSYPKISNCWKLPENIRLLKTAWKYQTVWKPTKKYQTGENYLKILDCLKTAQKYQTVWKLPKNIRLLKTTWKYQTIWKLPKNIRLSKNCLKIARKYQTAENCPKISECLKTAQKYQTAENCPKISDCLKTVWKYQIAKNCPKIEKAAHKEKSQPLEKWRSYPKNGMLKMVVQKC